MLTYYDIDESTPVSIQGIRAQLRLVDLQPLYLLYTFSTFIAREDEEGVYYEDTIKDYRFDQYKFVTFTRDNDLESAINNIISDPNIVEKIYKAKNGEYDLNVDIVSLRYPLNVFRCPEFVYNFGQYE